MSSLNSTTMYVQLIEPDGTPNIKVTYQYAIDWCKSHPGWTWRHTDE